VRPQPRQAEVSDGDGDDGSVNNDGDHYVYASASVYDGTAADNHDAAATLYG
jgi:hypothetical protein